MQVLHRTYSRRGFTLIELMIVICIISILALIMIPNMVRGRDAAKLSSCKSNLRNMASAMESYAGDNSGMYPSGLNVLVQQKYISLVPTCPMAGTSTPYITGYEVASAPRNAYTICCQGNNHASMKIGENFPKYTGESGLIESENDPRMKH